MKWSPLLIGFLLAVHCAAAPNVLFIAVDDLNDWVGCLGGHPQVKTPSFDRLASRGVLFANAHCQAPLCNPSRASLLFGIRPSSSGLYTLRPGVRAVPALHDRTSLPQFFASQGYSTFCAGKIFHDGAIPWQNRHDEFQTWEETGKGTRPPKPFVFIKGGHPAMDWGPWPADEKDAPDWRSAEATVKALGTAPSDRPFFVACGFRLPHVPCYAPQKWFDLYPEVSLQLPPVLNHDRADIPPFSWYLHWNLPEPRLSWLKANSQWKPLVRGYLASVSFMDSQLGRVLDALEKTGRQDNTLVVLFSDHGWHLGEKAISGKNSLWERSTHVPLIIAGPGIKGPGKCLEPAELLDIFPTLADLAGFPPPADLQGHTLRPQLENPATTRKWPAITDCNQDNHSVRTKNWRYIRYGDGSEELYDMAADPNEWTNLLVTEPDNNGDVVAELRRWLPAKPAPAVEGSADRLLVQKDGQWFWEGKPIPPSQVPDDEE